MGSLSFLSVIFIFLGTWYLPNEVDDNELCHVYSHSGDLIKALQSRLPSIKSCSGCVDAFQKTSSKRQGTVFRNVHLQGQRLLGQIFTSNISHTQLGRKTKSILEKMVNFNFFTCFDHKKDVLKKFKALCLLMSAQEFLT